MSNIYLIQLFFCGERNRSGLIGENIMHAVIHAGEDTLKMLPFVLAVFLVLEFLEHNGTSLAEKFSYKINGIGPAAGAVAGSVPQCGFAAAAAKLWADKRISTGVLIAVFISTSDEALVLLLSRPGHLKEVGCILLIKMSAAVITGYAVDCLIGNSAMQLGKKVNDKMIRIDTDKKSNLCCCKTRVDTIRIVIAHTGKLLLIIFIFSVIMNIVIHIVGEKNLSSILMTESIFQPIIAAAVGLIPSCLPSILTTQLYMDGLLSFPSLMAALTSNAGIGLLIAPSSRIAGILFTAGILSAIISGIFLPLS